MKWRLLDGLALLLFVAAVVMLTLFHVMVIWSLGPVHEEVYEFQGWELWPIMWEGVRGMDFSEPLAAVAAAGFVFLCALILASPLLVPFMGRSRLLWWLVFCGSVACLFGTTGIMMVEMGDHEDTKVGFWLGMAAPLVHLAGVFLVRRQKAPEIQPG